MENNVVAAPRSSSLQLDCLRVGSLSLTKFFQVSSPQWLSLELLEWNKQTESVAHLPANVLGVIRLKRRLHTKQGCRDPF